MSEHTKEPWYVRDYPNDDMISSAAIDDRNMIYCTRATQHGGKPKVSEEERAANAKRIVLCVNACAGKTDAELEGFAGKLFMGSQIALWSSYCELKERNAALEQRVDELLEQALNMEGRAVKAEKQRGELQSKFDGLVAALTEIAWHRTPSEKCSVAVEKLEKMALAAITKAQAGEQ